MSHTKSLDAKLARIRANDSCEDFILADAKDADMGLGIAAPGPRRSEVAPFRSLAEYRDLMREIVAQGLVDIMLMSPSSSERLAMDERIFEMSAVTPAVRANDASDIWLGQSGDYCRQPSLPFQSASLGQLRQGSGGAIGGVAVDLGLYSVTFNNDAHLDREALAAYRDFRDSAQAARFRHFLEVFAPNAPVHPIANIPRFVNDSIARTLAGIVQAARPLFLKMPFFGAAALSELRNYDPELVIGILGGSAGSTYDAFRLVEQAKRFGARAALFGRKINQAEDQLAFVAMLRAVADSRIGAREAVRAYHGELQKAGLKPIRCLDDDLVLSDQTLL